MILITGANGQLGYDFQRLFNEIKEEELILSEKDTKHQSFKEYVNNLGE